MRRVEDVITEFDNSEKTDGHKIAITEWFQRHPGKRFDKGEVYEALHDDLAIGKTRLGQILKDLDEEDGVLDSHGETRISYRLQDDIIIPAKYQARAGLQHLYTIINVNRWGIIGVFVMASVLWGFLTLPFWFFSAYLYVSPETHLGVISEYQMFVFAFAMTLWLVMFVALTYIANAIKSWLANTSTRW